MGRAVCGVMTQSRVGRGIGGAGRPAWEGGCMQGRAGRVTYRRDGLGEGGGAQPGPGGHEGGEEGRGEGRQAQQGAEAGRERRHGTSSLAASS